MLVFTSPKFGFSISPFFDNWDMATSRFGHCVGFGIMITFFNCGYIPLWTHNQ